MKKQMTLCIVHQHPKVLLGMKKRGFGAGRWNGFGGKVGNGEALIAAARREIKEEAGIDVGDMEKVGVLDFNFKDKPDTFEVHIFKVREFTGEPKETEEMSPKWFFIDEIPFMEMWSGDRLWIPHFMKDRKFKGQILFDENDSVIEYKIDEVDYLS